MAIWKEFEQQAPDMASAARRLFALDAQPLGYLATVSEIGQPRIAPVCPVAAADNLYLIVAADTPKAADLMRGAGYALHAPLGPGDEELVLAGSASLIIYAYEREAVQAAASFQFDAEDPVFRLGLDQVFHAMWEKPGKPGTVRRSQAWHG